MILDLTGWDVASLLFKFLWYLGVIASVGGIFSVWLLADSSRRGLTWSLTYSLAGALLGFQAVIFYFLVQVGSASGADLSGMLNWSMIRLYMDLEVGETSLFRMAIFLLLALGQIGTLAYLARLSRPPDQFFFRLFYRLNAAALLLLLLSFQATGHVAPLTLPARLALVFHVLAAALWLGSLVPLHRATRIYEENQAQQLLALFSRRASVMVAVLLVAALYLVTRFLSSPGQLIATVYGASLLLKLVLVCALLGLAALNRWRLVPAMSQRAVILQLRRSIKLEVLLGMLVLALTVYLSTVIGPPVHG